MSKRFKTKLVAFLTITFSVVLVQIGRPIEGSATATASPGSSTQNHLHQKLLERKHLLDQVVDEAKLSIELRSGTLIRSPEYRQAKEAALRAGIDLCQSKDDRINIYREISKLYVQHENQLGSEVKSGKLHKSSLREAKIHRLEVEIELLREQLK